MTFDQRDLLTLLSAQDRAILVQMVLLAAQRGGRTVRLADLKDSLPDPASEALDGFLDRGADYPLSVLERLPTDLVKLMPAGVQLGRLLARLDVQTSSPPRPAPPLGMDAGEWAVHQMRAFEVDLHKALRGGKEAELRTHLAAVYADPARNKVIGSGTYKRAHSRYVGNYRLIYYFNEPVISLCRFDSKNDLARSGYAE